MYIYNVYIYSVCKLDCWSWSIYMCRFLELGSCIVVQQDLPARHVPVCADQICERRASVRKGYSNFGLWIESSLLWAQVVSMSKCHIHPYPMSFQWPRGQIGEELKRCSPSFADISVVFVFDFSTFFWCPKRKDPNLRNSPYQPHACDCNSGSGALTMARVGASANSVDVFSLHKVSLSKGDPVDPVQGLRCSNCSPVDVKQLP